SRSRSRSRRGLELSRCLRAPGSSSARRSLPLPLRPPRRRSRSWPSFARARVSSALALESPVGVSATAGVSVPRAAPSSPVCGRRPTHLEVPRARAVIPPLESVSTVLGGGASTTAELSYTPRHQPLEQSCPSPCSHSQPSLAPAPTSTPSRKTPATAPRRSQGLQVAQAPR